METTFENAQVGDAVYHIGYGWGEIKGIDNDSSYSLIVVFFDDNMATFTKDGRYHLCHEHPTLFWDEIKITPPPRPKRKVKREITVWKNVYPETILICPNSNIFSTRADADFNACHDRIACVELKGTYEVEE